MEFFTPVSTQGAASLGLALVVTSTTPLLLLKNDLTVRAASRSFCLAFELNPDDVVGASLFNLGSGEWEIPQLRTLLRATARGDAAIDAYELDLVRPGRTPLRLIVSAHILDFQGAEEIGIVVAVADVTAVRVAEKLKDKLAIEKQVLLQELQHRVANSLQIIASVLMQTARRVHSEETRGHLQDAHHRVMSIATLQKQLVQNGHGKVALRPYLNDLCDSIAASMISDHQLLTLTVSADNSETSAESSVSIGLIVTELVINALKHAYPEHPQKGEIAVDYYSRGETWELRVCDNGVGMPEGTDAKPGLGTGIVEALAKQLDATVNVTSANPGTLVSIVRS